MARLLVLLVALVALVGCGSDDGPKQSKSVPTTGTLLTFTRSGGVAGLQQKVVVDASGKATVTDRTAAPQTITLSKDQLDAIRSSLQQADMANLPDDTKPHCCDQFDYALTALGRTVHFYEGNEPADVGSLLSVVEPLLNPQGP